VNLFVLDPHTIYRRGLATCLEGLAEVRAVGHAGTVEEAWEDPALLAADLILLDHTAADAVQFVADVVDRSGARVLVCSADCSEDAVLGSLQAGAIGVLRKDTLDTETLGSSVRAAMNGTGVLTTELLQGLLDGISAGTSERTSVARLTDREQQVLSLIAAGHPTREVALQLSYSERTVKNVLHDVVTKLNARSRSQAVAHAVREWLI